MKKIDIFPSLFKLFLCISYSPAHWESQLHRRFSSSRGKRKATIRGRRSRNSGNTAEKIMKLLTYSGRYVVIRFRLIITLAASASSKANEAMTMMAKAMIAGLREKAPGPRRRPRSRPRLDLIRGGIEVVAIERNARLLYRENRER